MLFLYSLKITGYKVLHLSLNLITIVGMLMISLCLLISPKHLEDFWNFLNGRDANISFTVENEKQNRASFIDV